MQKISISGNLTKDAEIRQSNNGGEDFMVFTVACNRKIKGEKQTNFYDVIASSSRQYQAMKPYLTKGAGVIVIGDFSLDTYTRNDGTTAYRLKISADSIEFNSNGKKEDAGSQNTAPANNTTKPAAAPVKPTKAKPKEEAEDIPMRKDTSDDGGETDDLPF